MKLTTDFIKKKKKTPSIWKQVIYWSNIFEFIENENTAHYNLDSVSIAALRQIIAISSNIKNKTLH